MLGAACARRVQNEKKNAPAEGQGEIALGDAHDEDAAVVAAKHDGVGLCAGLAVRCSALAFLVTPTSAPKTRGNGA